VDQLSWRKTITAICSDITSWCRTILTAKTATENHLVVYVSYGWWRITVLWRPPNASAFTIMKKPWMIRCHLNRWRSWRSTLLASVGTIKCGLQVPFTSLLAVLLKWFFIGESALITYIPVHKHMQKKRYYEAIYCSVLSHNVALLQYMPACLNQCASRYWAWM